ncbi:MAG: hypothetical protein JWO40_350 [Candidatus Doudnabacteria bacterium]|nr:hypothetical protein [Candidatus Doudnabacteria bacterium]
MSNAESRFFLDPSQEQEWDMNNLGLRNRLQWEVAHEIPFSNDKIRDLWLMQNTNKIRSLIDADLDFQSAIQGRNWEAAKKVIIDKLGPKNLPEQSGEIAA